MILAFDTEVTGVDHFHGARTFFVTTCTDEGKQYFWEWDVDPLTRKVNICHDDLEDIKALLDATDQVVLQNAKFDAMAIQLLFEDAGIEFSWPWEKTEDTLVAGHLLASGMPHDLTSMALHYLGEDIQPFEDKLGKVVRECRNECNQARLRVKRVSKKGKQLFDEDEPLASWRIAREGDPMMPSAGGEPWKHDMWLPMALAKAQGLPKDHERRTVLRTYSNADSAITLPLWEEQKRMIRKRGLMKIYRERMRILPPIVDMERQGVTVHQHNLIATEKTFKKRSWHLGQTCQEIAKQKNCDLTLPKSGNNKSLSQFVFGEHGLRLLPRKRSEKTGAPSFDKEVLEAYIAELEDPTAVKFLEALRDKRLFDTARNYLGSYRRFWHATDWDDVYLLHSSLNPTGTAGLRCSSSNPNSQNVGKKDKANLRRVFGPPRGYEWWALDYENIELRIPAYESGEEELIELFERPDDPPYYGSMHLLYFDVLHPKMFAEHGKKVKELFAATWYQWTKNGDFAIQYGCQEKKADQTYHVPGAYRKIKQRFSKLERLNQHWIAFANKHGYVETLPDKTVDPLHGFPVMCTRGEYDRISPTIPLNYHVQPSAMWCTNKAMTRCHEQLRQWPRHRMVMQVHDEIVFQMPFGGAKNLPKVERLRSIMEESGKDVGIPLKVSAKWHPDNWAESKEPE